MKGRDGRSRPSGLGDVVCASSSWEESVLEEEERSGEGRETRRGMFVAGKGGDIDEVGLEFS